MRFVNILSKKFKGKKGIIPVIIPKHFLLIAIIKFFI